MKEKIWILTQSEETRGAAVVELDWDKRKNKSGLGGVILSFLLFCTILAKFLGFGWEILTRFGAEKSREVKSFLSMSPLLIRRQGRILILFRVLRDFALFRSEGKYICLDQNLDQSSPR